MTLTISTLFLLVWKLGSAEPRVLQVFVSPIFHSLSPPMKLDRQIQLSCDVTADPPIDIAQIRWLADAVTSGYVKTNRKYTLNTQPSSGIHKHAESILTINKITANELGGYSSDDGDDIQVQDGGYASGRSDSFVHASGKPIPGDVTSFTGFKPPDTSPTHMTEWDTDGTTRPDILVWITSQFMSRFC
ncbi:hypothetical protein LSH36_184g03038 [Paralvinella palmiformis]|uniref:Ig-like domain-containing protein n=1 Tax=Paralvinella palmiformis TaxID=53620 RepID=A0AAD9JRD0_9ANNE|nr:hypothetical protein LSH36_184g03038 [Paralvinella palmiformis]